MRKALSDELYVAAAVLALLGTFFLVRHAGSSAPETRQRPFERRLVPRTPDLMTAGNRVGPVSASTILVEFSDFQCPYCRRLDDTLQALMARHSDSVAVLYRHFPLRNHPAAMQAAIASECAAEQGRFEQYARRLFRLQDSLGLVSWERLADEAGIVDTVRFRVCRGLPGPRARVEADIRVGTAIGVTGTPVLVLNREAMTGAAPLDTLEAWLRHRRR